MDAVGEFQNMLGSAVLRLLAEHSDFIRFAVIVMCIVCGWMAADGLKRPRDLYERLFGKGHSKGQGDIQEETRQ